MTLAWHRRRREEDVFDPCLDGLDVVGAKRPQPLDQLFHQVLGGGCARGHTHTPRASEPGWIELRHAPKQVTARARDFSDFSKAIGVRRIRRAEHQYDVRGM